MLLTGETGTGKELVARAIHDRSQQRHMPLIKVNCAAIPETLIESELFGHVRGAFTGATSAKKGRFALADGGTIFLDEIATLGSAVQSKLLRVLQEREFEPLGVGTHREGRRAGDRRDQPRPAASWSARAASRRTCIYRLHVIPIELPPLRQRLDDLPALVDHFVQKFAQRLGKRILGVDEAAMAELKRYHWPGNVRELENTIERAVVLTPGTAAHPRLGVADGRDAGAHRRAAVIAPASERRMGRARDHPPRPGTGARRQEGRRRAHGSQPARAQPLPRQASDRLTRAYARGNGLRAP